MFRGNILMIIVCMLAEKCNPRSKLTPFSFANVIHTCFHQLLQNWIGKEKVNKV